MSDWTPDIFEYLDYREFLRDYYEAGKEHSSSFSYRYFARKAGISSPSFLRHVIRGERNLGDTVANFSKAIGFDEEEAEFFGLLVDFNQAETDAEKNRAFEKVAASRRFRNARRIDRGMFEYLSHWYYPAIREMAARPDFSEDPAWIAEELMPSISEAQAAEALEELLELGLLERNAAGEVVRGDPSLTTEHEVRSLAIANYHRQMLERAGDTIEKVPREARDLAAMTVCISRESIAELKRRVHDFREILFEYCDRDENPEVVFQINTQLFPLSQLPDTEDDS
ncbi:MAG: TIGR02147 family protein [Myxococcota bacterium]